MTCSPSLISPRTEVLEPEPSLPCAEARRHRGTSPKGHRGRAQGYRRVDAEAPTRPLTTGVAHPKASRTVRPSGPAPPAAFDRGRRPLSRWAAPRGASSTRHPWRALDPPKQVDRPRRGPPKQPSSPAPEDAGSSTFEPGDSASDAPDERTAAPTVHRGTSDPVRAPRVRRGQATGRHASAIPRQRAPSPKRGHPPPPGRPRGRRASGPAQLRLSSHPKVRRDPRVNAQLPAPGASERTGAQRVAPAAHIDRRSDRVAGHATHEGPRSEEPPPASHLTRCKHHAG